MVGRERSTDTFDHRTSPAVLSVRPFSMPSKHSLEARGGIRPDVVWHVVVDKRIKFLRDKPFAVRHTGHEARAVRGVGCPSMPHLIIEHRGVRVLT